MYIKELDGKGLAIDGIVIIFIMIISAYLISWLLTITGNSLYTLVAVFYTLVILFGLSVIIENCWGPISVKILYRARYEQEARELETFKKLPINYPQ